MPDCWSFAVNEMPGPAAQFLHPLAPRGQQWYKETVTQALSRFILPLLVAVVPVVLLLSSLQTFRELERQKTVYLRSRAGNLAARLERMVEGVSEQQALETLTEEEPGLWDLKLIRRGDSAGVDAALASLWEGRELFLTSWVEESGVGLYRVYVPFHSSAGLRIARIDLNAAAADFLLVHARHNVMVSLVGGLVVALLAVYGVWATRRAARLEIRQREMEHLAQIGKMAAVLAHEIRNPLGTVKGFAQLAGEKASPETRALLEPILTETVRLENLVNDLLRYGRPPAPEPRRIEWPQIAATLRQHAAHLIGDRPIRFQTDEPTLAWVTDPDLLQQALLNLVRNAVEAVAEKGEGEVRVELRRHPAAGLSISVVDDGPGIPASVRMRLFEPFVTTKSFGTGLGLATTRKLVESLGGTIALRDRPEGGSRAEVLFESVSVEG